MSPETEELAAFLGFFIERYMEPVPTELHPLKVFNEMATRDPNRALSGLRMAVGDCVEMSARWPPDKVREADDMARARGVVTLSEIRRRYWKKVAAIERRGEVRTDEEYYLIKAIVADARAPSGEQAVMQSLLGEFETKSAS
jgi:hypothetical protein